MTDPEVVQAAAEALLAHRGEAPMEDGSTAPFVRAVLEAEAVLHAVERLIRAKEREQVGLDVEAKVRRQILAEVNGLATFLRDTGEREYVLLDDVIDIVMDAHLDGGDDD